jgi:hypothetical protein
MSVVFSENVADFTAADVTVVNASILSLTPVSANTFQLSLTTPPSFSFGQVSASIAAG